MEPTDKEPLELAPTEDLDAYAAAFGLPRDMVRLARKCPECDAAILVPDNGVWLDAKPVEGNGNDNPLVMGIMKLGTLNMACSYDAGGGGSAHTMHEHRPPER